jgi:hypothetical protein
MREQPGLGDTARGGNGVRFRLMHSRRGGGQQVAGGTPEASVDLDYEH